MKKKGVILFLTSMVIAAVGGVLKIMHIAGADVLLAIGIITLLIAIGLFLYASGSR